MVPSNAPGPSRAVDPRVPGEPVRRGRSRVSVAVRLLAVVAGAVAAVSFTCGVAAASSSFRVRRDITVGPGQTYVVPATVRLHELTVDPGGTITVPAGYSLTMTVDGVETGQKLISTSSTDTAIVPGTYRGNVVLTVAVANPVAWQGLTFPFRQALYVDGNGLEPAESVFSNVLGGQFGNASASHITLLSTGEAYDGVYVNNAAYTLNRPTIAFEGNGRSDFIGDGAAIVGNGSSTRLVINHAQIANTGAVRTGVVANNGANVIVKNSYIRVRDGVLPSDYVPTVDLGYMEQVPWMLSIAGNVRATNLVGDDTNATYINSAILSQGWGVLSTDAGTGGTLTAINSYVANTGDEGGYGTYAIGNRIENLLGDTFDVGTYATINRGGAVYYGNSTHSAVSALNSSLDLGLTPTELAAIPDRPTIVNSKRFGFMWHGAGTLSIGGGTIVNSNEATFLDKGQTIGVTVDGSQGARLNPANGILEQVMENDDPGPNIVSSVPGRICSSGCTVNNGVYTDPTGAPTKVDSFDVTTAHSTDAVSTFSNITLHGDFYNGIRGNDPGGPGGPGLPGLNMALTFDNSSVDGVISAATTRHLVNPITAANYQDLGEVANTVSPVINNGVIVDLEGNSKWTVPGTSYLSKLVIGSGASVTAPQGRTVTMTVNGTPTPIQPGNTYTGDVELTVS